MADISFGPDGRATFPTKYHGDVTLTQSNWEEHICGQAGRQYYRFNGEKVATALLAPDFVRYQDDKPGQFIYYKTFDKLRISDAVEVPRQYITPS